MKYDSMLVPPDQPHRASGILEKIKASVRAFEQTLQPGEAVGVMLAAYGSGIMAVSEISYLDPDLFVFRGMIDDNEAVLIQHRSQLNFVLMRINAKDTRGRSAPIGFSTVP